MADEVRLIDANALRLMKVAECAEHTIEFAAGWKACVEYCKNDAPAIEAEPVKHGRWEEKHYMEMKWIPSRFDDVSPEDVDIEPMVELKCSKCHLWSVNFRNHIELKYCPNCGARMEGDE